MEIGAPASFGSDRSDMGIYGDYLLSLRIPLWKLRRLVAQLGTGVGSFALETSLGSLHLREGWYFLLCLAFVPVFCHLASTVSPKTLQKMLSILGGDQSFRRILPFSMSVVMASDSRVAFREVYLSDTTPYLFSDHCSFALEDTWISDGIQDRFQRYPMSAANLSRMVSSLDAVFSHRRARLIPSINFRSRAHSCLLPSSSCTSPASLVLLNSERKNLMRSSESSRMISDLSLTVGIFLIHPFN